MIPSRSAARKLASGLRGFANAKKKPDFYKPSGASDAAAPTNPAPKPVPGSRSAQGTEVSSASQKAATGEAAASKPVTPPVGGAPAAPQPGAVATPSAASVPKPGAPATPPAAGAAGVAKPAEPAAATAKPATSPAEPAAAAAAAAAKPATPVAAAAAAPTPSPRPAAASAGQAAKPTPAAGSGAAQQASSRGAAGSSAGTTGGGGSGGSNGWLLHPSLPVDVRLLGAGLVAAGATAYSLGGGGGDKPAEPGKKGVVEEADFIMQPEPEAAAGQPPSEPAGDAQPAPAAAEEQREGGEAAAAEAAAGEQKQEGQEGEEEVTYVDGSKVLGLIEEVFSKEAQQAAEQAAQAAAASQQKVADAGRTAAAAEGEASATHGGKAAPAAVSESKAAASVTPAKSAAAPAEGRQKAAAGAREAAAQQRRAEERVAAIQSAVADQAGEAVASDFVQSSRLDPPSLTGLLQAAKPREAGKEAGKATAAAGATAEQQAQHAPGQHTPAEVAEALAAAQRLLGVQVDVSGAGLIAEAIKRGMGPSQDWSDYPQRHRQAEADAAVLADLLQAAAASVERQLAAARREADAGRAQAAAAARQVAEQADNFRLVLKEALARAKEQQRQQLRRQAEELTAAHAEMTVRERAERAARLDGVRQQLNALEQAFHRRSNEQRTSHEAHQLSLGAFALRSALTAGQPLGQPLSFLQPLAAADPVVRAAVQAVPQEAAVQNVPTRAQLADAFQDVERLSRALCMLPEGQGGMLSVAVAKLAAKLKIAERGPLAAALPGDGIDRRLAAAQQRLLDGQLLAAAAELEAAAKGTAAASVVADWARAVRVRVTAEQSTSLLEAHAAAETASLA